MTWPFATHQLFYGARMFLVVFRFFSPVSLIRLRAFSLGSHFFSMIPCSTELVSKEGSNCNNMSFRAESSQSSQSGSHVITIIQNFSLVSLTSSKTPQPVRLSFGTAVPSILMYSTFYALVPLRTCLYTHLSHRYVCVLAKTTFRLGIYLRLSTCQGM